MKKRASDRARAGEWIHVGPRCLASASHRAPQSMAGAFAEVNICFCLCYITYSVVQGVSQEIMWKEMQVRTACPCKSKKKETVHIEDRRIFRVLHNLPVAHNSGTVHNKWPISQTAMWLVSFLDNAGFFVLDFLQSVRSFDSKKIDMLWREFFAYGHAGTANKTQY